MKHTMRTTKLMAIALIALASVATEQTQAQGELEYAENLFAIVWYERKPADQKPQHHFKILHWKRTEWVNSTPSGVSIGTPIEARTANGFNKDKEYASTTYNGTITLFPREIGNDKNDSVVFYIQTNTRTRTFFPERALKVEVFFNRRTAVITHQDTGFRRMVPVQRYATKSETSSTHEKEPRTAINFGPLK